MQYGPWKPSPQPAELCLRGAYRRVNVNSGYMPAPREPDKPFSMYGRKFVALHRMAAVQSLIHCRYSSVSVATSTVPQTNKRHHTMYTPYPGSAYRSSKLLDSGGSSTDLVSWPAPPCTTSPHLSTCPARIARYQVDGPQPRCCLRSWPRYGAQRSQRGRTDVKATERAISFRRGFGAPWKVNPPT